MEIKIVPAYDQAEEVSTLFTEYTDMLIENDSSLLWNETSLCKTPVIIYIPVIVLVLTCGSVRQNGVNIWKSKK